MPALWVPTAQRPWAGRTFTRSRLASRRDAPRAWTRDDVPKHALLWVPALQLLLDPADQACPAYTAVRPQGLLVRAFPNGRCKALWVPYRALRYGIHAQLGAARRAVRKACHAWRADAVRVWRTGG